MINTTRNTSCERNNKSFENVYLLEIFPQPKIAQCKKASKTGHGHFGNAWLIASKQPLVLVIILFFSIFAQSIGSKEESFYITCNNQMPDRCRKVLDNDRQFFNE